MIYKNSHNIIKTSALVKIDDVNRWVLLLHGIFPVDFYLCDSDGVNLQHTYIVDEKYNAQKVFNIFKAQRHATIFVMDNDAQINDFIMNEELLSTEQVFFLL